MQAATVTETVLDLGSVKLTVTRPETAEETAYWESRRVERAHYKAAVLEHQRAERARLGDATGCGSTCEARQSCKADLKGEFEEIQAFGPTREALAAFIAAYCSRRAKFAPSFHPIRQDETGFTAAGRVYRYDVVGRT